MKRIIFIFTLLLAMTWIACDDETTDCYDAEMEQNHSGICTQDCPGVCGCDGETYCNECIANSKGISVVSSSPCGD